MASSEVTESDLFILRNAIDSLRDQAYGQMRLAKKVDRRIFTRFERATKHLSYAAGIVEANITMRCHDEDE